MRLILVDPQYPNTVTINYSWLPTWIGMNSNLLGDITDKLSKMYMGKELTPKVISAMELDLIDLLVKTLNMPGLYHLLRTLLETSPVGDLEAGYEEDR